MQTERDRLLRELGELYLSIRGSYFERYSVCGRAGCECHEGRKHGPRSYVTVSMDGVQRQIYVPQNQRDAVRKGISQYHRVQQILDRITQLNVELIREQNLGEPQQ